MIQEARVGDGLLNWRSLLTPDLFGEGYVGGTWDMFVLSLPPNLFMALETVFTKIAPEYTVHF